MTLREATKVAILTKADVAEIADALESTGRHNRLAYSLKSRLGRPDLAQPESEPKVTHKTTGWMAPVDRYAVPVLFSPYTGEPRDVRDVQSDPQGILIVPPGKVEMLAATGKQLLQVESEPASDREALVATLRYKYKNEWGDESLKQAADMLEVDAQEVKRWEATASHWLQKAHEAQQVAVPQEHLSSLDDVILALRKLELTYGVYNDSKNLKTVRDFLEMLKAAPQPAAYEPLTTVQISIAAVESGITRYAADEEIEAFGRAIEQFVRTNLQK